MVQNNKNLKLKLKQYFTLTKFILLNKHHKLLQTGMEDGWS